MSTKQPINTMNRSVDSLTYDFTSLVSSTMKIQLVKVMANCDQF